MANRKLSDLREAKNCLNFLACRSRLTPGFPGRPAPVIEKDRISDQMEQCSRFNNRSRVERGQQVGGVTPPSGMCPKGHVPRAHLRAAPLKPERALSPWGLWFCGTEKHWRTGFKTMSLPGARLPYRHAELPPSGGLGPGQTVTEVAVGGNAICTMSTLVQSYTLVS